jgi:hypothetical protein
MQGNDRDLLERALSAEVTADELLRQTTNLRLQAKELTLSCREYRLMHNQALREAKRSAKAYHDQAERVLAMPFRRR